VNYAASLAVLMVLAFVFPLLMRFAADHGVAAGTTTTTLVVLVAFWFAVWAIRARVARHRSNLERVAQVRAQLVEDPLNPQSFYAGDEHVGFLLLRLGRRREAIDVIDRYARLRGAREVEVIALRAALERAERRRRRGDVSAGGTL